MSEAWSGRPKVDDETAVRLAANLDGKYQTLAASLVELTAAVKSLDGASYRVRRICGQILLDAAMGGDDPHEFTIEAGDYG